MGFREDFQGTGKTYAEWSMERTAQVGIRSNEEKLQSLQGAMRSTFEKGISRIVETQESSAAALRDELAYQSERIVSAIEQSSSNVADAIQEMADYLGAGLEEVRWAVERHTSVSKEIVQALLNSLDSQSRQYLEQGFKCYDFAEYDIARERFERALESNRTNFFAYEYLGFIAVKNDNAEGALRNFELARKFAQTGHHRALALSHLARGHQANGDLEGAFDFSKAATEADASGAKFWYDHAVYCARLRRLQPCVVALREAIEKDWSYWGVAAADSDLDSARAGVDKLFVELRERERKKALDSIEKLRRAILKSRELGGADQFVAPCAEALNNIEARFRQNNVHIYRSLVPETRNVAKDAFLAAEKSASERLRTELLLKQDIETGLNHLRENSFAGYGLLCALAVGVVIALTISMAFGVQTVGPTRVFTVTRSVNLRATGEDANSGTSWKVLNESPQGVTVRFRLGDVSLSREELLRWGRLETGFAKDYSRTPSGWTSFLLEVCVPLGVWIFASKQIKRSRVSPQEDRLRDAENRISYLTEVKTMAAREGQTVDAIPKNQ